MPVKAPPTLAQSNARLAKKLSAVTAERDSLWKRLNASDALAMRLSLELATARETIKELQTTVLISEGDLKP